MNTTHFTSKQGSQHAEPGCARLPRLLSVAPALLLGPRLVVITGSRPVTPGAEQLKAAGADRASGRRKYSPVS